MKKLITVILALASIATVITTVLTYAQVNRERIALEGNLRYRSSLLADGLREAVEPNFVNNSDEYLQSLVERYSNRQRIAGLAIVDSKGNITAVSSSLPKKTADSTELATTTMDADEAHGDFSRIEKGQFYTYASPLHEGKKVVGALVVVQYADYVNQQLAQIWRTNILTLLVVLFVLLVAMFITARWVLSPLKNMVTSLRSARLNNQDSASIVANHPFLRPLMQEVSQIQQSLLQARRAATENTQASLEKLDTPWTEQRLKQFTKDILDERTIVTVSNREPYIHTKHGKEIEYHFPASGMVTAIEPVMQATGGIWIAHGSGDADRLVVDEKDVVMVPPYDPKYALKRVWLTEAEENGFYYGFSNQALYPLCLMAHTRPNFNSADWEQYKKVNGKFAETVLAEIKNMEKPVVFIQDFHFTLLPRMIKNARPDAIVGMFWHIPWVSPEAFSICPWKKEILDGMLGADLIGFHTQLHCNNFIDTVAHELESLIDYEHFTITRKEHVSLIKPFPASIAFTGEEPRRRTKAEEVEMRSILKAYGIDSKYVGVGVDRLDYTKGVLERFKAIEIFFTKYPSYRSKFTFLQISPPSKSKIKKYQEFTRQVDEEVERINNMFRTKTWKPIVMVKKHHDHLELARLYKLANLCLITSLHDGMNLVAKEYVAARNDEKGVLILSQFTGASKDFKDALIVNPYSAEDVSRAMHTALTMSQSEQVRRMRKLRTSVEGYNIYRWSAEFLKTIVGLS